MGLGKESMAWWNTPSEDISSQWLYVIWGLLISLGLIIFFGAL